MKRLGIVGFGQFGRYAARHLRPHFELLACDVDDIDAPAAELGARVAALPEVATAEIVALAVPVQRLPEALRAIAPYLQPGALVVDVCSVKAWPLRQMRALLPEHVEILGTHPMFGPQSAPGALDGHLIVLCPERCERTEAIAAALREQGLDVVVTDANTHDREAAYTQALAQYLGRALRGIGGGDFQIRTPATDILRDVERIVTHDTWELFTAIETLNAHAPEMRRRVRERLQEIEDRLAAGHDPAADEEAASEDTQGESAGAGPGDPS